MTHFKSSYCGHTRHRLGDRSCSVLLVVSEKGRQVSENVPDGDVLIEERILSLWIGGLAIHHDVQS